MSPMIRTRRDGVRQPARHRSVQPGVVGWLTLVWVLLWGEVSALTVVGGALIAVLICLVFPLPPLRLHVRIRPLALLRLLVRFGYDVGVASVMVARATLRRDQSALRNAVIEVPLRTPSDVVLTVVAEMVSLIPGSVVVEARRSTHTLFLHLLDVASEEAAEQARQQVLAQEQRVVRAFGARTDQVGAPVPTRAGSGEGEPS